jgi:hypothetical protein
MVGINETLEVLDGLKEAGVMISKIAADKKIGLNDLQHIVEAAKKFDVFKNAITGADKVIVEAKDLDAMEASIIVAKVFEIVKAIKEANAVVV